MSLSKREGELRAGEGRPGCSEVQPPLLLLAPVDVTGIPQTCSIWDFSTLIEQLAEMQGSEPEGVPACPA